MADIIAPGVTPNTTTRPFTKGTGVPSDTWFMAGPSCADSTPIMPEFLNMLSGQMRQAVRTSGSAEAIDDPRMLSEAMARYATGGIVAVQAGNTADDYDLLPLGDYYGATGYFEGMKLQFVPTSTNVATGSTRVRYGTILPYKKVLDIAGADLDAADFTANYPVSMRYNAASDGNVGAFILDPWSTPNFIPTTVFTKEFVSPAIPIVPGGLVTLVHGLGGLPKLVTITLECLVAEHGYSVGEVLIVNNNYNGETAGTEGQSLSYTAAEISLRFGNISPVYQVVRKSDGNQALLTSNQWNTVVRAFA
ncbi:MAG: hypothetical protein COB93_00255 [Sneathiella sp.]|nr:MAG: hypothetical protein COB93_00255 [Sneathiella sp.]